MSCKNLDPITWLQSIHPLDQIMQKITLIPVHLSRLDRSKADCSRFAPQQLHVNTWKLCLKSVLINMIPFLDGINRSKWAKGGGYLAIPHSLPLPATFSVLQNAPLITERIVLISWMVEITTVELPAFPTSFHDSDVLPKHLDNNWKKKKYEEVSPRVTMLQKQQLWPFACFPLLAMPEQGFL